MKLRELSQMCNLKMHVGIRSFRHQEEEEKERLEGWSDVKQAHPTQ
jgi:hypothetical protein